LFPAAHAQHATSRGSAAEKNEVPPPHKPLKVEDDELTNRKKLLCAAAKTARPCPLWVDAVEKGLVILGQ